MKAIQVVPKFSHHLTDLPLFSSLNQDQRRVLLQNAEIVGFEPGDLLFREGDPAESFYFLRAGRVKVCRVSPSGHEVVLHLSEPPHMVGCRALTRSGSHYPADGVAVDAVVALRFTRQRFLKSVSHIPEVFFSMLADMNLRLSEIYSLQSSLFEPVERRIATLLLTRALPREAGLADWPNQRLSELRMTKKLIAAIVGTSTETAIRVLSRWKKLGVIASSRGRIRLCDPAEIYRISQGTPGRPRPRPIPTAAHK